MIQMDIHGRLGNQIFQYASVKGIANKFGYDDIRFNFSRGVYSRKFDNNLKDFNVKDYKEYEKLTLNLWQKFLLLFIKIFDRIQRKVYKERNLFLLKQNKFEKKFAKFFSINGIYLITEGYVEFHKSIFKNQVCIGCFESEKYFENIKGEIFNEFIPKHEKLEKNIELYDIIEKKESVCVSIRRGDFLTSQNKNAHYVCTPEYFEKAVNLMQKKINNPIFIIFSDDVEWVKNNMIFPGKVYYETGDDPVWEKLRLMYSCKNFIISNSTFSWWAQYLSRNDKKVVIAPSVWKNSYQNNDIYQEYWTLINPLERGYSKNGKD